MSIEARIQYHADRAMRELDMGLAAACTAAARAHLQLSSLHMTRIQELRLADGAKPPLIMA